MQLNADGTPSKKRGRKPSGKRLTNAQKQKNYRDRLRVRKLQQINGAHRPPDGDPAAF